MVGERTDHSPTMRQLRPAFSANLKIYRCSTGGPVPTRSITGTPAYSRRRSRPGVTQSPSLAETRPTPLPRRPPGRAHHRRPFLLTRTPVRPVRAGWISEAFLNSPSMM
jgi:hypothetical protein